VARRLPGLWALGILGSIPGAQWIGAPVYDWIADRRQRLHHCDDASCAVPAAAAAPAPSRLEALVPDGVRSRATAALYALLAGMMFCCIWFSLPGKSFIPIPTGSLTPDAPWFAYRKVLIPNMPDDLHGMIQELELWQAWDMFSPNPKDTDTWLDGRGELADGTSVDVLRGDVQPGPIAWAALGLGVAPEWVRTHLSDAGPLPPLKLDMFFSRWSKFLDNLSGTDKARLLEFGRYLCRHWNNNLPQGRAHLKTFKIYKEYRQVAPIGQPPNEWKEDLLWDHSCF